MRLCKLYQPLYGFKSTFISASQRRSLKFSTVTGGSERSTTANNDIFPEISIIHGLNNSVYDATLGLSVNEIGFYRNAKQRNGKYYTPPLDPVRPNRWVSFSIRHSDKSMLLHIESLLRRLFLAIMYKHP